MADEATPATSVDEVAIPDEAELNAVDPKETDTPPAEEPKGDETEEGEQPPEKETPEEAEEETPVDPKERNRRGYAERTKLKSQVSEALAPQLQQQTAEQLVEQGVDPALAEIEALKQDIEHERFINQVTELNSGLNTDANNVMRDFPVFDEKSKQYDAAFTEKVEKLYKEAAGFKLDPTGQFVLSANLSLYDFYQQMAEFRGSGVKQGAVEGQKAAEKMLASAESPTSTAPAGKEEDDPFLAGLTGKRTNNTG